MNNLQHEVAIRDCGGGNWVLKLIRADLAGPFELSPEMYHSERDAIVAAYKFLEERRKTHPNETWFCKHPDPRINHAYAAIRCKSCSVWILLKHLGLEDGKTGYILIFPEPPRLLTFSMRCEQCGSTSEYDRNDVKPLSVEAAPPPDFIDQLNSVTIKSRDFGNS
jgi:hypothetical protein